MNLEDIKNAIDALRNENHADHNAIFAKLNDTSDRVARVETKQNIVWTVLAAIGAGVIALFVALAAGLFEGKKP